MGATFSTTITADGDHKLVDLDNAPRGGVCVKQGGTGTWKLQYSPDGGTTLIDMLDSSGTAFTGTASSIGRYDIGGSGRSNYDGAIYMNVTSASGLTLDVDVIVD